MTTITLAVPEPLESVLSERIKSLGASSKEEYLLKLVEADGRERTGENAGGALGGPFVPLPVNWREQVRAAASDKGEGRAAHCAVVAICDHLFNLRKSAKSAVSSGSPRSAVLTADLRRWAEIQALNRTQRFLFRFGTLQNPRAYFPMQNVLKILPRVFGVGDSDNFPDRVEAARNSTAINSAERLLESASRAAAQIAPPFANSPDAAH